jgi:signal transduction histidine kinase
LFIHSRYHCSRSSTRSEAAANNALRHNVAGGQVDISTATKAGQAASSVGNTGTAIPPGEIDRLFQPIQRPGHERVRHTGGPGLGLAIVSAVTSARGAVLTAGRSP